MRTLRHILFVNCAGRDDATIGTLDARAFSISRAKGSAEALALLSASRFDLVVINLGSADVDGISIIKSVRNMLPSTRPSILVIGEWGTGLASLALSAGADAYEPSPTSPERLIQSIERVLHKQAIAAGAGD